MKQNYVKPQTREVQVKATALLSSSDNYRMYPSGGYFEPGYVPMPTSDFTFFT